MHFLRESNRTVDALNSFYLGKDNPDVQTVTSLEELTMGQQFAWRHILKRVKMAGFPLKGACYSGALQALRVASSPYSGGDLSGVGDVVNMDLDVMSLPVMGRSGVSVEEVLQGRAGQLLRNPEEMMLQDASNWSWLSEEASKIKTYNDPALRDKKFFLRYLKRLQGAGVLDFSHGARGRVGSFCVSKKAKEVNGVLQPRQRLILDCRQVNLVFRAPPVTELGSLPAVCDLFIPDGETLYISGGDIKDCFYACKLPANLRDYFCLSWDVTVGEAIDILGGSYDGQFEHLRLEDTISPCISVFPMGFSWSFYLVQCLQVQACLNSSKQPASSIILDSRPPPPLERRGVVSMPYCDNTHSLSLDSDVAEQGKEELSQVLQDWGFELHEEVGATSYFQTLGGIIDGSAGVVKPTPQRFWNLKMAFKYAAEHPVSSDLIRRLLGHAMVVLVLNRAGISIFRSLYDFAGRDFKRKFLWDSAARECRVFMGLLPLLVGDMRRPWSNTVTCTDASPEGYGICERSLDIDVINNIGLWQERWRYKRAPLEHWKPREKALGMDPFKDLNTARADPRAFECSDVFERNEQFEEVPFSILSPQDWDIAMNGSWKFPNEHITLKEGRCLTLAIRRLARSSQHRGKRHLVLTDNLALAFSLGKGRSCDHSMLRINQKIGAILLACNIGLRLRWIPSELNVSDAPSRGASVTGYIKEGQIVRQRPSLRDSEFSLQNFESCSRDGGSREEAAESQSEKGTRYEWKDSYSGESKNRVGWQRGEVGPKWKIDLAGKTQYQQRPGISIPALPGELQGLLPGEPVEIPKEDGSGCSARRLLRRVVPQREKRIRRRKDIGQFGIFSSWFEGAADPEPEGAARLEEASSAEIAPPLAETCGMGNCDEAPSTAAEGDGSGSGAEFRPLPAPRGIAGFKGQELNTSGFWSRPAVSRLCGGHPRRRRPDSRQDRRLQQQSQAGQPGDNGVVGTLLEQNGLQEAKGGPDVQPRPREVPEKVPRGRQLAWIARSAFVSAQTWRRFRRLVQKDQRSQWCQRSGAVAHRLVSEKVCQDRQNPGAPEEAAGVEHPILPKIHEQTGPSDAGLGLTSDKLAPPTAGESQDWKTYEGHCCLEIFSGCGRLSRALQAVGLTCFPIDIDNGSGHDVLDPLVEACILDKILKGKVLLVWLGMPCTTFSVARRRDGLGPGPLRSELFPMGIPWLRGRDRSKLITGNLLFFFTFRVIWACLQARVPFVLENPESSRCWQTPLASYVLKSGLVQSTTLHFCQFGERWKKPTRLMSAFLDLNAVACTCKGSFLRCSYSGRAHIALKGECGFAEVPREEAMQVERDGHELNEMLKELESEVANLAGPAIFFGEVDGLT
eukprot:s689_g35.t1